MRQVGGEQLQLWHSRYVLMKPQFKISDCVVQAFITRNAKSSTTSIAFPLLSGDWSDNEPERALKIAATRLGKMDRIVVDYRCKR